MKTALAQGEQKLAGPPGCAVQHGIQLLAGDDIQQCNCAAV
jgi:hypothetical protein